MRSFPAPAALPSCLALPGAAAAPVHMPLSLRMFRAQSAASRKNCQDTHLAVPFGPASTAGGAIAKARPQWRQQQPAAPARTGLGDLIAQAFGTEFAQPVQGERWPSAVSEQPLAPGAVGGLDSH